MFAGALEWPGWARAAKTPDAAIATLLAYTDRYRGVAGAMLPAQLGPPEIAARLEGASGTDFGVPSTIGEFDRVHPADDELARQLALLHAAWTAFERAAAAAAGRQLVSGPRGGGRALDGIRQHVTGADAAYVSQLGAKPPGDSASWSHIQAAFVDAVHAKLRGELPERGPRGGERWPALYAIRRSAWHALDHAWEVEDRLG